MKEIFKPIPGYENLYEVSNLGNVKSLGNGNSNASKERLLKQNNDSNGYPQVKLYKDGKGKLFKVSRLVGIVFVANPKKKPEINHVDENKENNFYKNLEWSTRKENCNHGTRNKRIVKSRRNGESYALN